MFKRLKNFICKLFNIKSCQCDEVDEHIEYFTQPKPKHCGSHTRFIKSCHQCLAIIQ